MKANALLFTLMYMESKQTDGTGIRRITNPPSSVELLEDNYPKGSTTGKIRNIYGQVIRFLVYVQGAAAPVSVEIGQYGDVNGFSIDDIPDLGVESQYLVFIWPGASCDGGREYSSALVDIVAGEVTDIGIIDFHGSCGSYHCHHITWKRDGQEIGVDIITPKRFNAMGQSIGRDLFHALLTADKPAWSPINNDIFYCDSISTNRGIYLTSVGGSRGRLLVNPVFGHSFTPTWLPDGSGFIYTIDNQIRHYIFFPKQDTLLLELYNKHLDNPSSSSCGEYIVFEHRSTDTPLYYDLWVMQRTKPTQLWPLPMMEGV